MDDIIALVVSAIGAYFSEADFFVLFAIVSLALSLYRCYLHHANDKATLK